MKIRKTIKVGTTLKEDLAAVAAAWKRAEAGEEVQHHVVSFESWEALTAVLTPARYRLLRHLHVAPSVSIRALSKELDRDYSSVYRDVAALEEAGLIARNRQEVRAVADRVEVNFAA